MDSPFYYMTEHSFPHLHRGPMLYLGRGRQSTLSFPGDSSVPLIIENDSWLPEQSDNGFVLLLLLISATTFACKYFAQNVLYSFFIEMPLQYYNRSGLGLDITSSRLIVSPQIVRILIFKYLQISKIFEH